MSLDCVSMSAIALTIGESSRRLSLAARCFSSETQEPREVAHNSVRDSGVPDSFPEPDPQLAAQLADSMGKATEALCVVHTAIEQPVRAPLRIHAPDEVCRAQS